ncbi:hypothetical protein [Treponema sp.]|uniref:hypothetical protein n=1 Tax=Treponema sp. TaxID=166 RepID=UPI003FD75E1F
MKCTIIGVERRTGSFKPKDKPNTVIQFDNFNLHCVCKDMKVIGSAVTTVKIKAEDAGELIAAVGGHPEDLVNHVVDFDFDRFGKVLDFEVLK